MSEGSDMDGDFRRDCFEILRQQTAGRVASRRAFLGAATALGVGASLYRLAPAFAQAKELVVVNWGGDAVKAYDEIWASRYRRQSSGSKVVVDGSGPSSGKIKAMVESGKVTWDVCDRNLPASLELGRQNLLEKVDWSIVDRAKLRDIHRTEWGVANYVYSFVLAYDTKAWGGRTPKTWADFWNLKEFPGKRMLRKNVEGQLEAALMADGVPPAKLYPLDVKRALEKIKEIKSQTIFWDTGAASQQILRDREAVMGNLWHTRANLVARETDQRFAYTFNQGILFAGAWIVPKGNPTGKEAWRFVAVTQDPQSQVELLRTVGNGPVNPAADALVSPDLQKTNPSSPANLRLHVVVDAEWYAHHYSDVLNRYNDVISS